MRYILFIAAFFITSFAYGQGTWNKASTNNAWNRTKADSVAIVPRDTSATNNAILPSTGQPVGDYGRIQAKHGLFYFHDSIRNRRMAFYDDIVGGDFVTVPQLTDSLNTLNLEKVTTTSSTANMMSRELIIESSTGRLRFRTPAGGANVIYSYLNGMAGFRPLLLATGGTLVSDISGTSVTHDGTSSFQVVGTSKFSRQSVTAGVASHIRLADQTHSTRWEIGTVGVEGPGDVGLDFILRRYDNTGTVLPGSQLYIRRDGGEVGVGMVPFAGVALNVNGVTYGSPALTSNQYVTRQQVSDTIDSRLSAYNPGVPTFQQVTSAQNTSDRGIIITDALGISGTGERTELYYEGNRGKLNSINRGTGFMPLDIGSTITNNVGRLLVNSASDDGISAVQVNGVVKANTNFQVNDGTVNIFLATNPGVEGAIGTTTNHALSFITNNTQKAVLTAAGNVGIGTTSPGFLLDVNGIAKANQFRSNAASALYVANDAGYMEFYNTANNTRTGYLQFSTTGTGLINDINTPLSFGVNGTENMRIDVGGNVGIGTTTPTSTLHVKGSFAAGIDPTTHTSNFTVGDYYTTIVNNGSGSIAVTLPSAASCPDRMIQLKITGNANPVTVDGNSVNMAWAPSPNGPLCIMQSNGSNWIFLQGF